MKAMKSLVMAAALTAAGMVAVNAQAAGHTGGHGGGHWSGGHFSGGHWSGGHWRGGHFVGGLFIGAAFAPWFWGYPYYGYYPYDYYYPRTVVVDRVIEPYPASYPEGVMQAPATTEVPRTEGAPTQGPAYMNYCASAKAYFPKVTSCPEGWKFVPAR